MYPLKVDDKPYQVLRLTMLSVVRLRASKLRDVQLELECPRKRTRAVARINGVISYNAGLGANGEPRIRDTQVGLGSNTTFVADNTHVNWCRCGRNAKRLKEIATLRAWMNAIRQLNGHWGVVYGDKEASNGYSI